MAWNFRRIIKEDQEELAASREKSLAASSLMEKATNGTSAPPESALEMTCQQLEHFSISVFSFSETILIDKLSLTGCGVLLSRALHPDHCGYFHSRRAGWPLGVRWHRGGNLCPVWVVGQDDFGGVAWTASGTGKSMFRKYVTKSIETSMRHKWHENTVQYN